MARDAVGATDRVVAGLVTEVVPPRYPCPKCGKETSRSVTKGLRHCKRCDFDSVDMAEFMAVHQELEDTKTALEAANAKKKEAVQQMRAYARKAKEAESRLAQILGQ